jgi:hypothetical protein
MLTFTGSRVCCRCCVITSITSTFITTTHGICYTLIWCTCFIWFLSWRINITCNIANKYRLLCKLKQTWIWIMILTMTGITSRAGTANFSGASELTPGFEVVRIAWMLVFCVMFCGSLFAYLSSFPSDHCNSCPCLIYGFWLVSSNFFLK